MKHYVLPTTKFARECVEYGIYGATNSNWLANIEVDDTVFISQFNYKTQEIYGPFKITRTLFHDKTIIYPKQKYYYRVKFKPINAEIKKIKETDLYLNGVREKKIPQAKSLICLIQQNKHLHAISLNPKEGEFVLRSFKNFSKNVDIQKTETQRINPHKKVVDVNFLENKSRIYSKKAFVSESDLEAFLLINLKNKKSSLYLQLNNTLNFFSKNNLDNSVIYNQFVFGNAYPADLVIINSSNINIFELKKDPLDTDLLPTLKREMQKYCYHSLFSSRLDRQKNKKMNFFLITLKGEKPNKKYEAVLKNEFGKINKNLKQYRENNFKILEYYIERGEFFLQISKSAVELNEYQDREI